MPSPARFIMTTPNSDDVIDITNLVSTMQATWIKWATKTIDTAVASNPSTSWLRWPVIGYLFNLIVELILTKLSNQAEMLAFFGDTAVRKASQAVDYINATAALKALPETISEADYAKAEQAEITSFRSFVTLTQ